MTWRRVVAGFITVVVTLYAVMAGIPALFEYVQWMASWVEVTPMILFPLAVIAVLVLMTAPMAILAVGALSLHWGLCRAFGAPIEM